MKILFRNYLGLDSTQSKYLARALASVPNVEVAEFANGSLYDALDQYGPEYVVVHAAGLDSTMMSYLTDDDTPSLKLAICCNGLSTQDIEHVETGLSKANLLDSVVFLFSTRNPKKLPKSKCNMVALGECADDELVSNTTLAFPHKIDTCVIDSIETSGMLGSWHNVALTNEKREGYDYCLPLFQVTPLLKNYNNVVITTKSTNIPQICFDSLLSGCNVTLRGNNPYTQESLDEVCVRVFGKKLRHEDDQESIKELIKEKHLPRNRAKTFISQLPVNQRYFEL